MESEYIMKKQQFIDDVLINLKNEASGFSVLSKNGGLLLVTPQKMVHCEINRGVVTIKAVSNGNLTVETVDYNTGFKDNAVILTAETLADMIDKNEVF